ncbi:MAG TPA: serine/threonine-protein phosphatase [Gammaproteobacteria bacterium]|nr:serine/threonine-protein phosphatase [Gammaproteobacteria bacterium]
MSRPVFMPTAAAATHAGLHRNNNEDSYCLDEALGLFLVADGMGGHTAGEVASRTAVAVIRDTVKKHAGTASPSRAAALSASEDTLVLQSDIQQAITAANQTLFSMNRARELPTGRAMGTTLAGVYLRPPGVYGIVFHVGDCRVYLWRGQLQPLTQDHSLYQQWRSAGQLGPAPGKNVVLRALGPWAAVAADTRLYRPQAGDVLLLCSDGLTDMVERRVMEQCLRETSSQSLQGRCDALVELANAHGGNDNVTAVLVQLSA